MKKIWLIAIIVYLMASTALSRVQCPVEGYLNLSVDGAKLLVNPRANSEITISLHKVELPKGLSGGFVRLILEFNNPCLYECQAVFIKFAKLLAPYERPAIFHYATDKAPLDCKKM